MNLKELGQEIKKIRKEKSITQAKICKDLEISRVTLSNLENGKGVDIGIRKIMQFMDYLGYEFCLREKNLFPTLEDLQDE